MGWSCSHLALSRTLYPLRERFHDVVFQANLLRQPASSGGVCPICHGEQYIDTPDHRKKPCICLKRKQMRDYLTPSFADALWVKPADGFDTTVLDGRNVFIQNHAKWPDVYFNMIFRAAVKSFLMNNRMSIQFLNCGGAKEVADAAFSFEQDKEGDYERLEQVDLLLLYLAGDPANRHYTNLLLALIKHRVLDNKATWIATSYSLMPDDGTLDAFYGPAFVNYIKPRRRGDTEGVGGGNFALLDTAPLTAAFTRAREKAA